MDESILVGDLPQSVTDSVVKDISAFSVGLSKVYNGSKGPSVELLGSGTLVTVGSKRAILTAHHVIQVLPKTGRLGLLLWSTDHPTSIDIDGLGYVQIARGTEDSVGPDLGAIVLSTPIAGSIAAQKSFYNLDTRRESMLNSPPHPQDGFWVANGFVAERTSELRDGGRILKRFHNLCSAGGVELESQIERYDYFSFPVSSKGRQVSPEYFNGMSGGGLWQVPLRRGANGQPVADTPILSGVVFYQVPTTETECGLRCHGRKSVYEVSYDAIRGSL